MIKKPNNTRDVLKDPVPQVSDLFQHLIETARDITNPVATPTELSKLGWVALEGDGSSIVVNIDQVGRLLALANMNERQAIAAARELTLSYIRRDRVAFMFTIHRIQASIGIGGKGQETIKQIMTGATQKISQNVQQHKLRRIFTGGKNKQQEEEQGYGTRGPVYGGGEDGF